MPEVLEILIGRVVKAIKTVLTLKPARPETKKVFDLIPRTINAALLPLRQWIAEREYKLAETEKLLAQKLEHVAADKIVTPEAYVAVPVILAISVSMNSKVLQNLYANLLAKAMYSDTKELVHPSFLEIIKQMSPIDAKIFCIIKESNPRPLITIDIKNKSKGGQSPFAKYCSWITEFSPEQCRLSFANLCRIGLIEIPRLSKYTNDNNYNSVRQNPAFIKIKNECLHTITDNQEIVYVKKYIKLNPLSDLFYDICVKDEIGDVNFTIIHYI